MLATCSETVKFWQFDGNFTSNPKLLTTCPQLSERLNEICWAHDGNSNSIIYDSNPIKHKLSHFQRDKLGFIFAKNRILFVGLFLKDLSQLVAVRIKQ
jgi:hypothetical protein